MSSSPATTGSSAFHIVMHEKSSLLHSHAVDQRQVSKWKFWDPNSASYRFFLLVMICFVPFGAHFVKNGMSSIEQLMLDDKDFPITNTMYGAIIAAGSIPNMIVPFLGGIMLDVKGHRGLLIFLVFMIVGQVIFTCGMQFHSFILALTGRVIFGFGMGSVIVGSRVIVSHWFENRELTFAMGMTVAIANVSKLLAKASVAPIAVYFNSYLASLWYTALICVFSFLMAVFVLNCTRRLKRRVKNLMKMGKDMNPNMEWIARIVRKKDLSRAQEHRVDCRKLTWENAKTFSVIFWLLAVLHVVFVNVFHLFQNVSSSYLYQNYGYDIIYAGFVSSLSHSLVIFAPVIGILLDKFGGQLWMISFAGVLSILSYAFLIWTTISPITSMVLMSLCLSFTPTVLMASVPLSVPSSRYGVAFGILEVTDAFGSAAGNIMIGYFRDLTGNYQVDMYILLGMAVFSLCLTLFMIYYDRYHDQLLKNLGRSKRFGSVDDDDICSGIGQDLYNGASSSSDSEGQHTPI